MYDYIKGQIVGISPTEVVMECGGIGFSIMISLQTYDALKDKTESKIYIYHYLREDEEEFYGFATTEEREIFKLLISVSGVGVSSARMMLSSLSDKEITSAIISEDVHKIKSVKGIGQKTAQRIILDLKDKIMRDGITANSDNLAVPESRKSMDEAATALLNLGFTKVNVTKTISEILKSYPNAGVEQIIREALKRL